jgi:hypothetical protein
MATDSLDQLIPSYENLAAEMASMHEEVHLYGDILDQLSDLFAAIKESHAARVGNLCEIGQYLGSDWANHAWNLHETSKEVLARAKAAIPKRAWRTCGFPDNPRPEELAEERAFAMAVCEFPKPDERSGPTEEAAQVKPKKRHIKRKPRLQIAARKRL